MNSVTQPLFTCSKLTRKTTESHSELLEKSPYLNLFNAVGLENIETEEIRNFI